MDIPTRKSMRSLQRKFLLHTIKATVSKGLLNSKSGIVLTDGELSFRIDPDSPYYQQIKEVLNSIASDHWVYRLAAAELLAGGGAGIPKDILQAL